MTLPVAIRPLARGTREENFVRSSWLLSQRDWVFYGGEDAWDPNRFHTEQRATIDRLMASPEVRVLVAHDPEDIEQAYGWVAFEGGRAHYLYVKKPLRHFGIGRSLYEAAGNPLICTARGFCFDAVKGRYGLTYRKETA